MGRIVTFVGGAAVGVLVMLAVGRAEKGKATEACEVNREKACLLLNVVRPGMIEMDACDGVLEAAARRFGAGR